SNILLQTASGAAPTTKVWILSGGQVGINSSAPTEMLEVTGNIFASGNFLANGEFEGASGSAASPGLNFQGLNSGVFESSGDIGFTSTGTEKMRITATGRLGIGTTAPSTTLDVNGAYTQRGMAAPAVAPAGQGRIYFDSGTNQFMVSQNTGAYATLAT